MKSIRTRLILILSLFALGIVMFGIFMNVAFFENYYIYQRQEFLLKTYQTVNELYNRNEEDIHLQLEQLDVNKGVNLSVRNGDEIVYSRIKEEYERPRNFHNFNSEIFKRRMPDFNVLYDDGNCVVRNAYDSFFNSYHMELSATLDNGYKLSLRMSMQSIEESVKIANHFLMFVGVLSIMIGIILTIFISKSFTKPILELSDIAQEMSELNFDVKYKRKGKDEINILGESINSLSDKLEKNISELKTANAELQRDIEIKNSIDETRRNFLSSVSHELKTPIALIQGYAEGLKENVVSSEEDRNYYCDVIIDESEKMTLIIRRISLLMQLESGNDEVIIKRFNISEIINDILQKNEMYFLSKGITVKKSCPEDVFVWGDELLVENVIQNYISNAINHVKGEKIIEVSVQKEETEAKISVFNTGDTIPDEDIDKIWQSFYKVDKARTREYGGTGIGLAVVAAIMKSLGKPYWAKNKEDGVEFGIKLDL